MLFYTVVRIVKIEASVAVDDETILWTTEEFERHLVAVEGCKGLLGPVAQDRLLTFLEGNFGPATPRCGR